MCFLEPEHQPITFGHEQLPSSQRMPALRPDLPPQGGAVLEPETGYYDEPVVTLDFASLYPSIMQLLGRSLPAVT